MKKLVWVLIGVLTFIFTPAIPVRAEDNKRKPALHPGILAGVGGLALAYAAYEYRQDIANRFHQLRNFRKNRGETGQST